MAVATAQIELRRVLLAVVLFVAPFEVHRYVTEYPGAAPGFSRFVTLGLIDVFLLAFVVLSVPSLATYLRGPIRLGAWVSIGLLVAVIITLPFHGSQRGVALLIRLVGTVLITLEIGTLDRHDVVRLVVGPLVAAAAVQGLVALGQAVKGGPLGIPLEPERFGVVADTVRPGGTTSGPYLLATYSLLAAAAGVVGWSRRYSSWLLIPLGLAAVPIGLSFSRAAVVSVLFAGAGWMTAVMTQPRRYARPVAAVALGIVIPALMFLPAWLERVDDSTTGNLNDVSTNRVALNAQAIDMIADHPLVGVGPWRYTQVAEAEYALESGTDSPVHSLPLLVATEMGVVIGLGFALALLALGVRAVRTGAAAFGLFGVVMGFTLFDVVLYWYPVGLILLGVWFGLLDRAGLYSEPASSSLTTETTEPVEP